MLFYLAYSKLRNKSNKKLNSTRGELGSEAIGAFFNFATDVTKPFENRVLIAEQGVNIIWSGTRNPHLNTAYRMSCATSVSELEETLRYLQGQYNKLDKDGTGGMFIFDASSLLDSGTSKEDIKRICQKYSFKAGFDSIMAREGGPFDKIDTKGLEIKRVTTLEQLEELLNLFLPNVRDKDKTDWSIILEYWKSTYSFVGYIDGKAVACATALVYNDKLLLGTVSSHPDYRKRGYDSVLSRYALKTAIEATGYNITLLHASEFDKPVNEKLGFVDIGTLAHAVYKPT
jgi:hypothetical protein